MAGLRVGYALGRPETIAAMSRFRLPIGVNALGAAAALASIGDERHLEREVKLNGEARTFTRGFFERAGYACSASQTNFLMVGIRRPIAEFKDACAKRGVAVGRPFPPLNEHARISIGTMDEMRRAVSAFDGVLRS
jgi:histidinol-phosphate aminotransferase